MANIITFNTVYGKVSLYKNDVVITGTFMNNIYWDEDTLMNLKPYVDPDKNILEIGGHCGTSTLVYASFLNKGRKVYVYEPQRKMYELLVKNIEDNNLTDKIIPFNKGVFCYNGYTHMNEIDLDGGGGVVEKRYNEESDLPCNFGGIGIGSNGEKVEVITVDSMDVENIGFIHCDAQGAENFIFSRSLNLIDKYKPCIYFEDNEKYDKLLYDNVCKNNMEYEKESKFNIVEYCVSKYNYKYIERFDGLRDTLLYH